MLDPEEALVSVNLGGMLVWINGAFGAGKTQTAHELRRRLNDSHVADPELLGFALHKMLPRAARGDFQDFPQWRTGVVATLRDAQATSDGPVIVPMTLVRNDYFDEIIGELRSGGIDVRHYTLTASRETLRQRLQLRLAYVAGRLRGRDETWAIQQIDRCVSALSDARYATHVATDDRSIDEVVEAIAEDSNLLLNRARLSPMRYQARRLTVAARHIRL